MHFWRVGFNKTFWYRQHNFINASANVMKSWNAQPWIYVLHYNSMIFHFPDNSQYVKDIYMHDRVSIFHNFDMLGITNYKYVKIICIVSCPLSEFCLCKLPKGKNRSLLAKNYVKMQYMIIVFEYNWYIYSLWNASSPHNSM